MGMSEPKRFNHKEMGERSEAIIIGKVYLIPIGHIGTSQGSLRLVPTTNNQEKNIRWAKDYEI